MRELIELSKCIPPQKLRYKNLLGQVNDKADLLYHLIINNEVEDRDSAIEALFKDHKFPEKSLLRTNSKLKQRLIIALLCAYDDEESEILRSFKDIQKQMHVSRVLRAKGKHGAARVIAEAAIKKSVKYEFTDLTLAFARDLSYYYAMLRKKKQFNHYSDLMLHFQEVLNDEIMIENYYNQTIFSLVGKKHYTQDVIQFVEEQAQRVSAILERTKTYWSVLLGANVWIYYYQLNNDNKKVAQECWNTIEFFESLPYTPPYPAFFSFLYKLIPLQILFKQFAEVHQSIQKCLGLASEGSHNWVITKQYEVVAHFHEGNIETANRIIQSLKTDYASSLEKFRETWLIYEAYALLLMGEKVRLGKFLNDVPEFSKDKRGMNVNVLIIQILVLLQRKNYNGIIDRTAALERYSYRYLKKDDTYRSNCFIHILLKLEKGNFNLIAVKRHAARYLKALKSLPLEQSKQDLDVEVVPYELLWGKLEELLD